MSAFYICFIRTMFPSVTHVMYAFLPINRIIANHTVLLYVHSIRTPQKFQHPLTFAHPDLPDSMTILIALNANTNAHTLGKTNTHINFNARSASSIGRHFTSLSVRWPLVSSLFRWAFFATIHTDWNENVCCEIKYAIHYFVLNL